MMENHPETTEKRSKNGPQAPLGLCRGPLRALLRHVRQGLQCRHPEAAPLRLGLWGQAAGAARQLRHLTATKTSRNALKTHRTHAKIMEIRPKTTKTSRKIGEKKMKIEASTMRARLESCPKACAEAALPTAKALSVFKSSGSCCKDRRRLSS